MTAYAGARALITGGGDGIGRALAQALAAAGAQVAVLDIRASAADETVAGLPGALALQADVADPESLAAAAQHLTSHWGALDILWINAGVASPRGVLDASPNEVRWVMGVNVFGPVWTAQAFLPLIREGDRPAIGVTASIAALESPSGARLYSASKHATLAIGEAIRDELQGEGIGVTLFCPGLLSTNIWNGRRARPERYGGPRELPPIGVERWTTAQPPMKAVDYALTVMARGGGYAIYTTESGTVRRVEARSAAIREGLA